MDMNSVRREQETDRGCSPASMPASGNDGFSGGRRQLFRGISGGVGVLLAVQAKTALGAGQCLSPSAAFSGNASPRPADTSCSGGLSPGFWKVPQHFNSWTAIGLTPPKFNASVGTCLTGMKSLTLSVIKSQGTLLTSIGFTGAPANTGVWAVLAFPTSFPPSGNLLRTLSAAYLNAKTFTSSTSKYPLTLAQIVDMWNATKNGGTYCPTGTSCGSSGWTANQVIAYIEGMYDLNASGPEPALCYAN
jgi:hypothetical protein